MAVIKSFANLESMHLLPLTNEDKKVIKENLNTYKKLYLDDKNLKIHERYPFRSDRKGIAFLVEDLDYANYHYKNSKRKFVFWLGRVTDFKDIENKHRIWDIEEDTGEIEKRRVLSGEIVIVRDKTDDTYFLGIGKASMKWGRHYYYRFSSFKINNMQKAKELIHQNRYLELTTDETIKLIQKLKKNNQ